MSCGERNKGRRRRRLVGDEEEEEDERENESSASRASTELEERNSGPLNGSIATAPQLSIDEGLLVDPKLLFIGSKIGEGAHGKVYEGRSVSEIELFLLFH